MTDQAKGSGQDPEAKPTPIFAELASEVNLPGLSEITFSQPPHFAEKLISEALSGRHRVREQDI